MTGRHYEAVRYLKNLQPDDHPVGIILGTGLGGLVKDIKISSSIDYSDIPNFPVSTVESHSGKLIFGKLSGKNIIAMQGRFHFYEGYSMDEVTFPVQVLKELGVKSLIVSNACGSVNPAFRKTELMIMTSHINLLFDTPLKNKKINDPILRQLSIYDLVMKRMDQYMEPTLLHEPFTGPIVDQKGVLKLKPNERATVEQLWTIDWFVEGVVGEIPAN